MRKLLIILSFVALMLTTTANNICYFTASQASRCVNFLNKQNELMIYCGYENEIETYVLVNEIWSEPVNSRYYELWVFGYDAYTGEEIYMPLDLACVWLSNHYTGHLYSAATYLRFRSDVPVPTIIWNVPAYNHFTRTVHLTTYVRTYHYDIHRPGWRPPLPPAPHGPNHPQPAPPIHPYYNRVPSTPAPTIIGGPYTPGKNTPTYDPVTIRQANDPVNVRPSSNQTINNTRPRSPQANPTTTNTTNNSRPGTTTTTTTPTSNSRPGTTTTTTTPTNNSRPGTTTTTTPTNNSRPGTTTTTTTNSRPTRTVNTTKTTTTKTTPTRPANTTRTSTPTNSKSNSQSIKNRTNPSSTTSKQTIPASTSRSSRSTTTTSSSTANSRPSSTR